MNVVCDAADRERRHLMVLGDPLKVCPELFLQFRRNAWHAVLGAEDAMNKIRTVGMAHVPPLWGSLL
jgi:hypothetical protein